MAMTNAEWMIKQGYKFRELDWICSKTGDYDYDILLNNKCIGKVKDSYSTKAITTWLDMEHVEPILDDVERKYLSAVIKPFREHIEHISKHIYGTENREFLLFYYKQSVENTNFFYLPTFKRGTMYKGMKPEKEYTLEELGL